MNDSALDILAGTFKKQETLTDTNTYTFESKITVLDKNIGAGCPVHVFEKATGTLIYTTETDSESFIYVPNLLKNIKYFVVATDKNDTYSSIIFDLNWDFAQQSGNKYNLKYYNKYQASGSKDIYTYTDTVSDLVYDPSLLYSISVPLQKEDQKATWFGTGIFNVENIDGFPSFSFKGSSSTYTYINFTPVQTGDSFTVECYIRPLALFSGKTVAGSVFSQNTSQGLFISDDFRLSYKNKNLTINTISTLEADTWYHVAVSYDSKRIRLFLNGKKEAETEDSIGLEYLSTVFCVGAGFYGYLSGFKIFQESKYEDDFTPNFRPFGYLPVIYSNEEDPYANNTVLKSYISDSGYLKDKAKNTPLSFDYTIPKDSYIISNNSFIRTPTQYADLALNGDFTIEVKFRLLYRTGANPVIFGNKANKTEWVTNNWHLHADYPSQLEKYGLSIYGGNYNNSLANYPTIYNEPVSLVLQRKGTTYSYYFNGFADRSFTYATAMDTKTSSYFSIGGDTSFELYDIKITKGVARYSENYKDEQLQGSETLLKAYYQIVNYPFKESLYDARNALAFVNTGVLLTSTRSSYKTKSALFANSYFVTSKSYWYTPNESFTVEFKISCKSLPLKTAETVNTATLFSIFTATFDNFKLAIRDKYLSFYNGIEWLDSEFELDDEDTFKHIVLQRNSTSIKILAEGSLVLETTCPDLAGRRNVSIGANKAGSDTFNGYMNNLFIYKNYSKYEDNYEVPQDPNEYVPTEEEKEPDVLITPYTTSALNFENGLIDKVPTTVWQKEGTADITSVNKIFGQNSFETKALGDSLYTNSNIITGGSTPFTIEFYGLFKNKQGPTEYGIPLVSQNNNASGGEQQLFADKNTRNLSFYRGPSFGSEKISPYGSHKIKENEINKYTLTYDGSAIRIFFNNTLDVVYGISNGWTLTAHPLRFFDSLVPNYSHVRHGLTGLIENINIHDGIATKVRDYDPYEEYLVVDLAFDGENNSTKIVDNGSLKSNWLVKFNNPSLKTSDSFNNKSALYLNGIQNIKSDIDIFFDEVEDFTFSFEFVRISSSQGYIVLISTNTINYQSDPEIYSINAFTNNYPNSAASYLRNKLSFIDEKNFDKDVSNSLISKTNILDNVKYKIDIVRKNKITYLYINNVLDTQTNIFSDRAINFGKLCIGHCAWSETSGYAVGLNGYIKNFKIYKGVAVIPENPTGKIQLDFDNNLVDKYGNSTWTNNGVTFDQVNSVKGHAAYFNGDNKYITSGTNNNLNYDTNDFSFEFDVKNTNVNKSKLEVVLCSGDTNIISSTTKLQAIGVHYQSNFNGSASQSNELKSLLIFGYFYNNIDYLQSFYVMRNVYYHYKQTRKGNALIQRVNDVITNTSNYNLSLPININNNNNTVMGKCLWRGNDIGTNINSQFDGYIDNFKSIKDYKELVIIDKPAVHLPLETNAINTGFTPLTINSVGSPSYTTIDGKKCIKFESGKYLTINSNNIFNLGTSSDFYIEFDFYPLVDKYHHLISAGSIVNDLTTIAMSRGNSPDGNSVYVYAGGVYILTTEGIMWDLNKFNNIKLYRKGTLVTLSVNGHKFTTTTSSNFNFSKSYTTIGQPEFNTGSYCDGYMSNFKMFVGTSEIPETYNDKKVLDLDFAPTGKSYLFKDNNNKCVIHPVNITQRDYQDSQYCCTFNGTNQYLQLGKNDLFNFGNDDFIIHIRFKITEYLNSWQMILGNNINTTNTINGYAYIAIQPNTTNNPSALKVTGSYGSNNWYVVDANLKTPLNEIIDAKIVNINNNIKIYINGVDVTITGSGSTTTISNGFNFNANNNTYIGYNADNHKFKGTIYSVKVLRNTSDLSLLVDKVKRPPVETVVPDYRGLWVNSLAVWNSSVQDSPSNHMNYDPFGSNSITQEVLFNNTRSFLANNFKKSNVGPVLAETSEEFLIDINPLNKVYRLAALAGTWNATYLKADFEFLDSNDNVIMVMRVESDSTFYHSIWCGAAWTSLVKKATNVVYTELLITLDSNIGLVARTLNTNSSYASDFSFTVSNFESIAKLKIKNLKAYMDYTGGSGHAAYVLLYMLKDLSLRAGMQPLVDVGYPVFTACDLGTQALRWTRGSLTATPDAKGFKGVLSNTSITPVSMFYTQAFTIDFTVAGYGNIFKKWATNLRYSLNLSNTGILTYTFYTSNSGQKTFTFNLGAQVVNPTRLTLTKKEDGTLCLWVDGVLQTTSHSILSSYTYYADVNEPMDIGDSTLELYSLKVFDSSIGYIENLN